MVRIFFIRHGQASFHAADYDQLSEVGAEQSRLLGEWFDHCGWPVHHVVAGGMKRHLQSAECFFAGYPGTSDWRDRFSRNEGLNELDHRDVFEHWIAKENPEAAARGARFSDMTPTEFETKWPDAICRWAADEQNNDAYAEPWPIFNKRCVAALHETAALGKSGENILVFTSAGTISAICRHILGISAEQMVRLMWEMTNGSFSCITHRGGDRYSLSTFNTTAHLDRVGRPELITIK